MYVKPIINHTIKLSHYTIITFGVGHLLDELGEMNLLDGWPHYNEIQRQQIVKHDMHILDEYFAVQQKSIAYIGSDLLLSQTKDLLD